MVVQLLLRLRDLDVEVWVEGDRLKFSSKASISAELRDELNAAEADLVRFLQDAEPDEAEPASGSVPAIRPIPRDQHLPLSFAQQRLWFLDQFDAGGAAYNMALALWLRGNLDVASLEWSLGEVVRRHEVLSTTFVVTDGKPEQVLGEPSACELEIIDLTVGDDPQSEAKRLAEAELERRFDLTTGPLYSFMLLAVAPDQHMLLITMHHIISDGWSYDVILRELAQLYEARRAGRPSPLAPLEVQYVDYASWQHEWYAQEADTLKAYWQDQLAGLPTLDLPTDRPRQALQTFGGSKRVFTIPTPIAAGLKALALAEGCTFFTAMLAAFNLLLARYSGQRDVVVGTPVANRNEVEIEPLVGPFLNNLVLRTDLSGAPTFRELLRRVRDMWLEAWEHQEMPFEQLVVELKPDRDTSRNPLFQVLFNFLGDTSPSTGLGDLQVEVFDPENASSKFDFTLAVQTGAEETRGIFEYSCDLFDDATIARLEQHLLVLLGAITADPDQSIGRLPMLVEAEHEALVEAPNRTERDYPRERCFHELFAAQAGRAPDAVAVTCGEASLAYAELEARANRLAHHLRGLGASRDGLVGLCVDRSVETVVALLAIQKSGAAYVPLDPSHPAERLALIIEDAGVELLVTEGDRAERLPSLPATVVRLDVDAAQISACSAEPLETIAGPDDLAYVIFTSGSTGRPKGVQIEHRALVNFLVGMAGRPGMSAADVLVAVTTISFDIAGLELYLPLLVGGRVVVADRDVATDGRDLAELLTNSGATVMQATPATWRLLVESGWQGSPELRVLCGGEALPRELADQLLERSGELWNMYGPTETTIWSLVSRVEPGEGPVSIGEPMANTEVYVLDADRQAVPVGVSGELHIGGDGLARGYLDRAELTAERFVAHPFRRAARLYRTGDLVRWGASGALEFLGRIDHQVKVRGFRIELGEIEHTLMQHEAVHACAVIDRPRSNGDVQLEAHIVFEESESATVSELRRLLRDHLPEYMLPPAYQFHPELPLTPNGKLDRAALLATGAQVGGGGKHIEPKTDLQKRLAAVWQEVLEVERVGLSDNFFDLGGHSLLAMRVVFKVEKDLGVRVQPMELLLNSLDQFVDLCEKRGVVVGVSKDS